MNRKVEDAKLSSQERDAELLKKWRKEKAIETTLEVGAMVLCGVLNGFSMFGMMIPNVSMFNPPKLLKPEDIYSPKSKRDSLFK